MLSVPDFGWSKFCIPNTKTYSLSYLTDVALEWIKSATYGLKNLTPFAVEGFCEPGRMLCTVSFWKCYVLLEEEDKNGALLEGPVAIDMSMADFCQELYKDINDNLEAWVTWFTCGSYEKDDDRFDLDDRREDLVNALTDLKETIDSESKKFKGGTAFF